jgi:chemotaxis protein MotB
MAQQQEGRPIIIVKKVKKGHAGHHGGAWKVAYADFVTAMMAFFMVMWIVGMDQSVKSAVEGYFQNPIGFQEGKASTRNVIEMGNAPKPPSSLTPVEVVKRQIEEKRYEEIGEKIEMKLEAEDGLGSIAAQVEIVMTEQGLRIELVEGDDGETFFEVGSSALKPPAVRALRIIGGELGASTAPIVVEGHTDSAPYSNNRGYTNWDLSTDRANAARRSMESSGLGTGRIAEIRGYADKQLRVEENPYDNSNRRISILLPFTTGPANIAEGASTLSEMIQPPQS